jgi:hypothetical protein
LVETAAKQTSLSSLNLVEANRKAKPSFETAAKHTSLSFITFIFMVNITACGPYFLLNVCAVVFRKKKPLHT